jgi:hypothetical protein
LKKQEIFRLAAFLVIGVSLLSGMFWYIEFNEFVTAIGNLQISWIIISVVAMVSIYLMRSLRWQLLLKPVKDSTSLFNILAITVVGFFVNAIIPIRTGEIFRAFFLREKEGIRFLEGFSSIVSERILDVLGIVVLGIMATFTLPGNQSYPLWFLESLKYVGLLIIAVFYVF